MLLGPQQSQVEQTSLQMSCLTTTIMYHDSSSSCCGPSGHISRQVLGSFKFNQAELHIELQLACTLRVKLSWPQSIESAGRKVSWSIKPSTCQSCRIVLILGSTSAIVSRVGSELVMYLCMRHCTVAGLHPASDPPSFQVARPFARAHPLTASLIAATGGESRLQRLQPAIQQLATAGSDALVIDD